MNGMHDLGGRHGLGPINPEKNEPVFHEKWEGRAFGLFASTFVLRQSILRHSCFVPKENDCCSRRKTIK